MSQVSLSSFNVWIRRINDLYLNSRGNINNCFMGAVRRALNPGSNYSYSFSGTNPNDRFEFVFLFNQMANTRVPLARMKDVYSYIYRDGFESVNGNLVHQVMNSTYRLCPCPDYRAQYKSHCLSTQERIGNALRSAGLVWRTNRCYQKH